MSQLSQVAVTTKKVIKYAGLGLVSYLILSSSLKFGIRLWRQLHPEPPPEPTVAFGKLSAIEFPQPTTKHQFTYKLETPSGGLPALADRATVYALPPKKANLLALDKAKALAKKLNFLEEPQKLTSDIYRFSKQLPALLTLDVNLINDTFLMEYQWQNDEIILTQKQFPSETFITEQVQQTLEQLNLLTSDLETGEAQVSYLKARVNTLISAPSLSEADFVRVDLFRNTEEVPVVTPYPPEANISFIFSGSNEQDKQIIYLKYDYYPVDYNSLATYPLKPITTAWEEFQANKAYIARVENNTNQEIAIRRIYLALYDSDQFQPFLQPVYVFQGDNNFVAYISAIDSEWLIQENP